MWPAQRHNLSETGGRETTLLLCAGNTVRFDAGKDKKQKSTRSKSASSQLSAAPPETGNTELRCAKSKQRADTEKIDEDHCGWEDETQRKTESSQYCLTKAPLLQPTPSESSPPVCHFETFYRSPPVPFRCAYQQCAFHLRLQEHSSCTPAHLRRINCNTMLWNPFSKEASASPLPFRGDHSTRTFMDIFF